ncbi:MAG: acyl-CoA dehydrogenase family protein [Aestuariivita sp.]|nr:acyl-CoA dehydrogenase family protein [Aestuariivita sp.]MCY4346187.1 acyl-CoA dehydrogenase family protein [Aestuariivita sp.]
MNFELSDEQRQVISMVNQFAQNEIAPIEEHMDASGEFPYTAWEKWSELGMAGILIPERYGGSGFDTLTYILAMEALSRISQTFALIWQVHVMVGNMYVALGNEQQKQEWLPKFASGEILGAFALTEPGAGSDSAGIKTKAEREGDGCWRINGSKIFISNASTRISNGTVLMAATGCKSDGTPAISCFILPSDTLGYAIGQSFEEMAWHGMTNNELILEDVVLPDANLLGIEGSGLKQALGALNLGRIVFGALGGSLIQACLDESLAYTKERKQFGKPLSKFQLTQAKLADMAAHAEVIRAMSHRVAWRYDKGEDVHAEAAMLKLVGTRLAIQAAGEAFQLHGGYGFMREYRVNRLYREAQILAIGEGTNEIQQILIARSLGC